MRDDDKNCEVEAARHLAMSYKLILLDLLDRDCTFDGEKVILTFANHQEAFNKITEARRQATGGLL